MYKKTKIARRKRRKKVGKKKIRSLRYRG